MIKSNELMIGNLLTDLAGDQVEVHEILHKSCLFYYKSDKRFVHWSNTALKAIPIEEEFLIKKFGFVRKSNKVRILKPELYIAVSVIHKVIAVVGLTKDLVVRLPLPAYVHQLQNLIYSVTGEELKIISDEEE